MAIVPIRNLGGGGSNGKTNLMFYPNLFASGVPNPTTGSSVNRTFTKGTYFNGLTFSNDYWPGNIKNISISADKLSWTPSAYPYGLCFVLQTLKAEKKYSIGLRNFVNCEAKINLYTSNGTFVKSNSVNYDGEKITFEIPSGIEYCVLLLNSLQANIGCSCDVYND